jgi:hypothetical protein
MKKLAKYCEFKAAVHCKRASTGRDKVKSGAIYGLRQHQYKAMTRNTDLGLMTRLVIK